MTTVHTTQNAWKMSKSTYRHAVFSLLFANWVLSMFVGWRPPFPFLPYGLVSLAVAATAMWLGVRAHRRGEYTTGEFRTFSACCVLYAAYAAAEAIAHVLLTQYDFAVRAAAVLPLIAVAWAGEKFRCSFPASTNATPAR